MGPSRSLSQRPGLGGKLVTLLFLLAAAAALSVLLLRPLCEASSHHLNHADRSTTCCASAGQSGDARASDPLIAGPGSAPAIIVALSFLFFSVTGVVPRTAQRFSGAPPRLPPYYARSLRILR